MADVFGEDSFQTGNEKTRLKVFLQHLDEVPSAKHFLHHWKQLRSEIYGHDATQDDIPSNSRTFQTRSKRSRHVQRGKTTERDHQAKARRKSQADGSVHPQRLHRTTIQRHSTTRHGLSIHRQILTTIRRHTSDEHHYIRERLFPGSMGYLHGHPQSYMFTLDRVSMLISRQQRQVSHIHYRPTRKLNHFHHNERRSLETAS